MNQADTIFALADLQDRIEDLERSLETMRDGYTYLLGRNVWGLTDYERVLGWRMLQVRSFGADPKEIVRQFPPDEPAPVRRYEATKVKSVMDS